MTQNDPIEVSTRLSANTGNRECIKQLPSMLQPIIVKGLCIIRVIQSAVEISYKDLSHTHVEAAYIIAASTHQKLAAVYVTTSVSDGAK